MVIFAWRHGSPLAPRVLNVHFPDSAHKIQRHPLAIYPFPTAAQAGLVVAVPGREKRKKPRPFFAIRAGAGHYVFCRSQWGM